MSEPRLRFTHLPILISLLLLTGLCYGKPDADIARVEENLLPFNIIEGESAYRLQDRMTHYRVPGLSVAVIENFEVKWVAHYGVREAGTDHAVDGETRFCVGSLSKAMTSACILSLVEQGLIDLNGDVNPQLQSWQIPANEFTVQAPVTPLLLMNHSAGLPRRAPFVFTADNLPTPLQLVTGQPPSRSGPLQVVHTPGTRFLYSNGGFTVLQILAEDVTGLPFDQAVRKQVFAPLSLERATFTTPLPASVMEVAASGHNRDGQGYSAEPVWLAHTAAGGLWITAEDYARFVVEVQKSALGRSNKLFSPELAREMISPHASEQYGLGVFLYEGNGIEPYFSHIGDGAGFVGGFASHRIQGFGAVVLTNGVNGINLCREILRSVGRVYDWPGYLPAPRRASPLTAEDLDRYSGRYLLGLDTVVSLVGEGGNLSIEADDLPGFKLYKVAADTFVCCERKGELVLGHEPESESAYLDLRLSDEVGRLSDEARRGRLMGADERTPLESLLAGETESACKIYLEFQADHPDHAQIQESRFNRLGYRYLREQDPQRALTIFELNTVLYPESANVYDSYGEALLAVGQKGRAIESYRKSLVLNPGNDNAVRVLKELGAAAGDS